MQYPQQIQFQPVSPVVTTDTGMSTGKKLGILLLVIIVVVAFGVALNSGSTTTTETKMPETTPATKTPEIKTSDIKTPTTKTPEIPEVKTLASPPFTAISKTTPTDTQGNVKIYFLDRHNVDCPAKSALSQFALGRPTTETINYMYTCQEATDLGPTEPILSTPDSDMGNAQLEYLDRQNVSCPAGKALSKFRLIGGAPGNIKYEYRCITVPKLSTSCETKTTGANELPADGNIVYLDRHNVICPTNKLLTQFGLKRVGTNQIQYTYTCCGRT